MNALTIPSCPNWYETKILACAPDNTLVYGSRNALIIINPLKDEASSNIKLIERAHNSRIISVDVNTQWGLQNKWILSAADDKFVKVWDMNTLEKRHSQNAHSDSKDNKLVGACFLNENRVLSVSVNGLIVIWVLSTNETTKLKDLFNGKLGVTSFAPCPHASYRAAFGLKNGLIVVADLRKNGSILFKLRGHDKEVVSLSWCPAPVNVFPRNPVNFIKGTAPITAVVPSTESDKSIHEKSINLIDSGTETKLDGEIDDSMKQDDKLDISQKDIKVENEVKIDDYQEKEIKPKVKKNPWVNLKHADDEDNLTVEIPREVSIEENYDFLSECKALMKKIVHCKPHSPTKCFEEGVGTFKIIDESDKSTNESLNKEDHNIELLNNTECEVSKDDGDEDKNTDDHDTVCEASSITDDIMKSVEDAKEIEEIKDVEKCLTDKSNLTETDERFEVLNDEESTQTGEKTTQIDDKQKTEENTPISDETAQVFEEANKSVAENSEVVSTSEAANVDVQEAQTVAAATEHAKEIPTGSCVKIKHVPTIVEEDVRDEYLLASSARDNNIYIWRAGSDGRLQSFLKIPEPINRDKKSKAKSLTNFTVINWVSPKKLLSTTKTGELLEWTFPLSLRGKKSHRTVHYDHKSLIFSIATPTHILKKEDWLMDTRTNAWTFGQDKMILNTSLGSKYQNLMYLQTLSGSVQCFGQSLLDPCRIMVGMNNGSVKIWNTTTTTDKKISFVNCSQKIQSKVTCIACHPTSEMVIAFCTEEGRIGLLNTNPKHPSKIFKQYFANQIHRIEWGPINGNTQKMGLYAMSDGKLVVYDRDNLNEDPIHIELPDNFYGYTFSWKLDYSMLLVTDNKVKLLVYSNDMKIISSFYNVKKLFCIQWHLNSGGSDPEVSRQCCWFAGSIDKTVYVYDFKNVKDLDNIQEAEVATLEGHLNNVNSLAWCPFDGNKLVSGGEDGIAYVWNVESKTLLASYYNSTFDPITAVTWSAVNADIIICGTRTQCIEAWNLKKYADNVDTELLRKHKQQHLTNAKQEQKVVLPNEEDTEFKEKKKSKKAKKGQLLPTFKSDGDSVVDTLRRLLNWKETGQVDDNKKISELEQGDQIQAPDILKLFGGQSDITALLAMNEKSHKERGRYDTITLISLWRGDFVENIKEAIERRRVTPTIVSLAPMVSHTIWQQACEVYASQLREQNDPDPFEIATHYLACHKIAEAIDSLCEHSMYKEALALAKCRLPEDSAFEEQILTKWAKFTNISGSYEIAAQCYIVLGRYEDAITSLFKRSDRDILKFALELARKTENQELIKAVEFRCKAFTSEDEKTDESKENNVELLTKVETFLKINITTQLNDHNEMAGGDHLSELVGSEDIITDKKAGGDYLSELVKSEDVLTDEKVVLDEKMEEKPHEEVEC